MSGRDTKWFKVPVDVKAARVLTTSDTLIYFQKGQDGSTLRLSGRPHVQILPLRMHFESRPCVSDSLKLKFSADLYIYVGCQNDGSGTSVLLGCSCPCKTMVAEIQCNSFQLIGSSASSDTRQSQNRRLWTFLS